ncbi:MAG: exodeoxyribonuclease VII small subunit [Endomicrobium sp.]|jgi:exodeoxyribonuclease VII small subunit|uniref:exodeoxyribonuclease VII small subunit n=1 Tax=Candidatus Endomicrobiellum cubanum TaxID=3242325 RepID=UPI002838AEAB|nr:exodeoxyribonuclease VII small subunit [Endomicrobium sp.]MDR2395044.1 exodeoxyribonuclease VII small subunit [Endomicrobium sp.]
MTKRQSLNFEKSLSRLEEIVSQIENTSLDLDKALELFKEGDALVKECSLKLKEAKKKIEIITSCGVEDFKE